MTIRASSNAHCDHFEAGRISRNYHFTVEAPPEEVFPLLCPVREREWLPGWEAEIIYSDSGLIENNCVFRAANRLMGEALYVTSRREPEKGVIEFVIFFPGKCVQKLDIALRSKEGGGTNVLWSRTYTSLSPEGAALLERITEDAFRTETAALAFSLKTYCRNKKGADALPKDKERNRT